MEFHEQISRARCGDRQAVDQLLLEWRPWMRRRAHGMLGEGQAARVDSSDVVQVAMAEAYQSLPKFRGASRAEWAAWLQRILRGQAIRIRRYNAAEMRRAGREVEGDLPLPDSTQTPASLVVQRERCERVKSAVSALPDPLQQLVQRRIVEQASFACIGRELGETPRAVRRRWMRALRLLAHELHESGVHSDSTQDLQSSPSGR